MSEPQVSSQHRARGMTPAVAAHFASLREARAAIEAVERAGVDAGEIELGGRAVAGVRHATAPGPVDRKLALYILPRILFGIVVGLLTGMGAGLAVVALVVAVTAAEWGSASIAVALLCGGLLGSLLGAFITFERKVGLSEDWALTFEDAPEGPVWLMIFTHDPVNCERARRALAAHEPLELR